MSYIRSIKLTFISFDQFMSTKVFPKIVEILCLHIIETEQLRSQLHSPSSGVPQGSHLGFLLFVIFIKNVLQYLTCQELFYAYDLKLYSVIT